MSAHSCELHPPRIVQEAVFGPCQSRRFGFSLGVNPLPAGSRLCNFDCVYCECSNGAWSLKWDLKPQFPDGDTVRRALAGATGLFPPDELDAITIAGNGEPTLCRNLESVVDAVIEARDYYWPQARTVILTNGTNCHRPQVGRALAKLDLRVVKLDAGSNWILQQLNGPVENLTISELVWRISIMPDVIIQSMFVEGPVDNTTPEHITRWIDHLRRIRPSMVQVYSLDREPAKPWVRPVRRETLNEIARRVEDSLRIPARVY
jgi:wyosine [tRNA(Phe)-imidazoG37] synthetase (radical SAM superfamily)